MGTFNRDVTKEVIDKKINRKQAAERGLRFYYSKCEKCDSLVRLTSNCNCPSCGKRRWREKYKYQAIENKTLNEKRSKARDRIDFSEDYYDSLLDD